MNQLLVDKLHLIRQIPFDIIVHIPRSGTIPASLLATYLCKPLASVEEFCRNIIITRKSDFKTKTRILLVDDSIRTGKQMQKFVSIVQKSRPDANIYTLAVYSTKFDRTFEPDIKLYEHDEVMYIYPWFMWKTERIEHCAVDMDGVLCRDATRDEDDDGSCYESFLINCDLKFKPLKHHIGAIVTSRLEKYRPQTEEWLRKNGIRYTALYMGPWSNNFDRKGNQAKWKAKIYQSLPQTLFVESSEKEAKDIARLSGKAVWCVDAQRAY